MNTHSLIILILYALMAQTISFDVDYTPNSYGVNGIIAWTEPNCQGIAASTIFNGSTLAKKYIVCVFGSHFFNFYELFKTKSSWIFRLLRRLAYGTSIKAE